MSDRKITHEQMARDIPRFLVNFEVFVKECLGISKSDEYGFNDLTPKHSELCKFLQYDQHKTKMVLMPRYSFKSTITTIGGILWDLLRNPNERILIYSDSEGKACNFLNGIKAHIEGKSPNSRFRDYFPGWETDARKGKWNESEIIISTRQVSFPEPSVDTGGIETSKVGKHYGKIYFDDIVSDLNVTSKQQMDKVYDCYKRSLSLLSPGGDVIICGTRWAFGDPYGRMIADTDDSELGKFIVPVESNGVYPFASIGLTEDFLSKQRRKQGSFVVSCLYYQNPISDDDAIFKVGDFKFYNPNNFDTSDLYITCTCDPAGEGDDFTAITVVGTDREMNMYLLDAVNAHLKPNQIVDALVRLNYKWNYSKLGVETNFFRGLLEKEIQRAVEEERKNPLWTPFSMEIFQATAKRGESKHNRIRALQPYHERGSIIFPCEGNNMDMLKGVWHELAMQMVQYTENHKPQFDDLCDALAYQIPLIRKGGKIIKNNLPKDSIAYILKQEQDKHTQMQRRIPSMYRKYPEPFIV